VPSAKEKPSSFPYAVMLAVMAMGLALATFAVYRWQHLSAGMDDARRLGVLYVMLGSDLVGLVISAACALGYTQWVIERRRLAGLPDYAAVGIGVFKGVLGFALMFTWQMAARGLLAAYGHYAGMQLVAIVGLILGHLITVAAVMVSIGLAFSVLREQAIPASPQPIELRGRALLMFTLFAWSWLLVVAQLVAPMTMDLYRAEVDALPLVPYAASIGLVLPAFLGGLLGLPRTMPLSRPFRLWLAGTLAVLVCALTMAVVTIVMVGIGRSLGKYFVPITAFSALVAVVWFVVSTVLCWLLVKVLFRTEVPLFRDERISAAH
jgi:hypothetical protein